MNPGRLRDVSQDTDAVRGRSVDDQRGNKKEVRLTQCDIRHSDPKLHHQSLAGGQIVLDSEPNRPVAARPKLFTCGFSPEIGLLLLAGF